MQNMNVEPGRKQPPIELANLQFSPEALERVTPFEVEVLPGEKIAGRLWPEKAWLKLCRTRFAGVAPEALPSAFVETNGQVQVRAALTADRETFLRVLLEEKMHLELGFPKRSGTSEFTAKLYREAAMAEAGCPPMDAGAILAEVLAYQWHDQEQIRRAFGSAEILVPGLEREKVLAEANSIRKGLKLLPIESQQLAALLSSEAHGKIAAAQPEGVTCPGLAASFLFKSREERQAQEELRNRENRRKFRKMMTEQEKTVEELVVKTCQAKTANDQPGFAICRNSLKKAYLILNFMKRAAASLESVIQTGRQVEVTTVFAETLATVGKQIGDVSRNTNFASLCGRWSRAIEKCRNIEEAMGMLFERVDETALEDVRGVRGEIDDELDRMIDQRLNAGQAREQDKMSELRTELEVLRNGNVGQS